LSKTAGKKSAAATPKLSNFAQMVSETVKIPHRAKGSRKSAQGPASTASSSQKHATTNGVPKPRPSATEARVVNGTGHSVSAQAGAVAAANGQAINGQAPQPKKRKRAIEDKRLDYHDQKQSAKEALTGLEDYMERILDVADLYRSDPNSGEVAEVFQQNSLVEENEVPVLMEHSLGHLDSLVRKAISESVFNRVDVGQLIKVQKLLQGTCNAVNKLTLSIGSDPSDFEVEEWSLVLQVAYCSITAVKVLLRTMTSKREEKELYSEDLVEVMLLTMENIVDNCITPVVEARSTNENSAFRAYTDQKKQLQIILKATGRTINLLGDLVSKVDFAEQAVTKVEYLARKLIFIENAPSEKESILGVSTVEAFRRAAVDTLAEIFARHPNQRHSLLDEILMSLEKLPSNRQNARQFKLDDRKPIQLVSALLMRLVQTSALWTDPRATKQEIKSEKTSDDGESDDEAEVVIRRDDPIEMENAEKYSVEDAVEILKRYQKDGNSRATESATHIIKVLIQRALNSTRSGDQPYRNLLDIFTEDFLNVLGLPEWPAADLLLNTMFSFLAGIFKDDKRPVPQKSMALDLITMMGSHIAELKQQTKGMAKSLETCQSPYVEQMQKLIRLYDMDVLVTADLIPTDGPFRMIFEYLLARQGDGQTDSARSLLLIQWATTLLDIADSDSDSSLEPKSFLQLRNTIPNHAWLGNEYDFFPVLKAIAYAASNIITVASKFCRSQPLMMTYLLSSIESPHSQLKSKGLKMVPQLLEKDASLLNQQNILQVVKQQIDRCSRDGSPLVRSSALSLLEKCIMLKPEMEKDAYVRVLTLSEDENAGVKKKALKIMKDIYLRNKDRIVKANISAAIIKRTRDHEDEVARLAKQQFEELWFAPLHNTGGTKDLTLANIAFEEQVMLMIKTSQRSSVLSIMEELLKSSFSSESRFANLNFDTAKHLVRVMFDKVIESIGSTESREQQQLGMILAAFAKASPKLFTSQQLRLLEPYIKDLSPNDSLFMFRAAVVIFRHVLPSLSSIENAFLVSIRGALMKAVPKIPASELPDTAACLWIIRDALHESSNLINLLKSLLDHLRSRGSDQWVKNLVRQIEEVERSKNPGDNARVNAEISKLQRYIDIAGPFGRVCDFDKAEMDHFKQPNKNAAALTVDVLIPFTRRQLPQSIRECALKSMCMVCQSWPQNYVRNDVAVAFEQVFVADNLDLQKVVLDGFLAFFHQEESRSETGAEIKVGKGAVHGLERLAKSFVASDNDGAVTTIAQKFLKYVLQTALASNNDLALTATKVIVSINRQGLVHPKECGPALIALETSTNQDIAEIAYKAHQILHSKHETMFEKEYMKAVTQAYSYQRDIIQDPRGITFNPIAPKMKPLFEVLKTGSGKVRQRFLSNIASRINFELPKLDVKPNMPDHVLFSRFILENLAYFDYSRTVELVTLISLLEKMVVAGTGAAVAHAIETEILQLSLEAGSTNEAGLENVAQASDHDEAARRVDPERLHQLAAASMILQMVWECRTHLRHVWGLQKSKGKIAAKDLGKPPTRQPFANTAHFVERINTIMQSLESTTSRFTQVRAFAELVAIDPELKVAADEDDEFGDLAQKAAGYETPSEGEGDASGIPGGLKSGSGRKRKSAAPLGGQAKRQRKASTPSKRGVSKSKKPRTGSGASSDEAEEDEEAWD
jgi:cohesin loading factor subunit SCC2